MLNSVHTVSRRTFLAALPMLSVARRLGAQEAPPTFSSSVKVVNVLATVRTAKGDIVGTLTKDDFVLEDDGQPRPITYFSRSTDLPLTIGLLVDTSASQRRVLDQEIRASREFFRHVLREDRDKAFVIHFDREVELLQDLTSSKSELDKSLDSVGAPQLRRQGDPDSSQGADPQAGNYPNNYPGNGQGGGYPRGGRRGGQQGRGGGTTLYDSVFLASDEVIKKQTGSKALLVLSDGVDNGSRKSLSSAIESAQRAETPVYTILFADHESFSGFSPGFGGIGGGRRGGGRMPPPAYDRPDGKKVLERLSKETGGTFFEVSGKHTLSEIYAHIEDDLRSQYSLGFPPGTGSGYHKIHLATTQKSQVVTARDGYYSD